MFHLDLSFAQKIFILLEFFFNIGISFLEIFLMPKDIIETFSTVNDNFNDVLIFALYGIIFLIFTDYIYKLGKKSY